MHEQLKYTLAVGIPFFLVVCVLVVLRLPIFADSDNIAPKGAIVVNKQGLSLEKPLELGWNVLWPTSEVSILQVTERVTGNNCTKIIPLADLVDSDSTNSYLRNQIFVGKSKTESTFDHISTLRPQEPVWVYLYREPVVSDQAFSALACIN